MANYNSTHTGAQIDSAVNKALNPDTAPTTNSSQLVTSGGVKEQLDLKAPLASPALTGNPTAPTQATGNNSTRLATTAFVHANTDATNGLNQPIAIDANTDLDTLLTPGAYYCDTNPKAATLSNCPVSIVFSMLVLFKTSDRPTQILTTGVATYSRTLYSSGWEPWSAMSYSPRNIGSFATLDELKTLLDNALTNIAENMGMPIRVNATANAEPFNSGSYYVGTLYKLGTGENASVILQAETAFASSTQIIACGRRSSGWRIRAVAMSDTTGGLAQETTIESGTDLDTLTTPGAYSAATQSIVDSLVHCPATVVFSLLVLARGTEGRPVQMIATGNAIFTRTKYGSTWQNWYRFSGEVV